jgi:hypothetical protein
MRSLIESLSLVDGAILIGVFSVGVVWLLCSLPPVALRPFWVVIVPLILACSLYWLPVWLGADASEYGVWAGLFIGAWFLSGAIPSALLVIILWKRKAT